MIKIGRLRPAALSSPSPLLSNSFRRAASSFLGGVRAVGGPLSAPAAVASRAPSSSRLPRVHAAAGAGGAGALPPGVHVDALGLKANVAAVGLNAKPPLGGAGGGAGGGARSASSHESPMGGAVGRRGEGSEKAAQWPRMRAPPAALRRRRPARDGDPHARPRPAARVVRAAPRRREVRGGVCFPSFGHAPRLRRRQRAVRAQRGARAGVRPERGKGARGGRREAGGGGGIGAAPLAADDDAARSRSLQVSSAADVDAADRLIFPGVGAYEQAMGALAQKGLTTALRDYVQVTRGASG